MFAGPEPIRSGGYTYSDSDELVVGDEGGWLFDGPALNTPNNVWLHEYVHTRQSFEMSSEMEWFTEGSAEYYAALLTYRQQSITNREAVEHLRPAEYRNEVLLSSEDNSRLQYRKGAAVLYALDQRIRTETNNKKTLADVFRRMNNRSANGDEEITLSEFKQIVANVSETSMDAWIDRYVTTRESPTLEPGDISILGGSGRIDEVTVTTPTDNDNDGYYSDFYLSMRADTTLDENDPGFNRRGEPYFEIRIEDEPVAWTDIVSSELRYQGKVAIDEERLEQFDRGELNITVVLWDLDLATFPYAR